MTYIKQWFAINRLETKLLRRYQQCKKAHGTTLEEFKESYKEEFDTLKKMEEGL
tara:strand:+ start:273 stop:434 length:162 start_codon:yes stop_codon:yes gene_type:complete